MLLPSFSFPCCCSCLLLLLLLLFLRRKRKKARGFRGWFPFAFVLAASQALASFPPFFSTHPLFLFFNLFQKQKKLSLHQLLEEGHLPGGAPQGRRRRRGRSLEAPGRRRRRARRARRHPVRPGPRLDLLPRTRPPALQRPERARQVLCDGARHRGRGRARHVQVLRHQLPLHGPGARHGDADWFVGVFSGSFILLEWWHREREEREKKGKTHLEGGKKLVKTHKPI